jgi:metal-dependent amidase/aminoacylase/carboxypeptidase family protein
MLEEGLFKELKPAAVFGLQVLPEKSAEVFYRSGATMASSDGLSIRVTGNQGHGGMPCNSIDPITTSVPGLFVFLGISGSQP